MHRRDAHTPHLTRAKQIALAARADRLAQALRENLRRRKEQTRSRARRVTDAPAKEPAVDKSPA